MFDRILVAVDPNGFNTALVDKAITLASATNAQLKLIGVLTGYGEGIPPMLTYPGLADYPPVMEDSLWENYQKRYETYTLKGLKKLRHLQARVQAAGVKAEITQAIDSPGHAICKEAKRWKADLIIVGSRGRRGLSEIFLGSVSNYVMHHAACSVMIVHRQDFEKEPALLREQKSKPIAV